MPFQQFRAKCKFLPPRLDFSHFQKKKQKEEEDVEEKKSFKLFLEITELFKESLLFYKDPHAHKKLMTQQLQIAAFCSRSVSCPSEQRALILKLPYKSGHANELI